MLQRAQRGTAQPAPASEKHTVILGSVSAVVSHAGLLRGGCKSPPAKVLNDSARRRWKRSISAAAIPAAGIPLYLADCSPWGQGPQARRWGGGGRGASHWAPCLCPAALWRRRAQTDTGGSDVRQPPRPTSRFRARLLFSAFICLSLFLFALSQLFFCHCLNEDLRGEVGGPAAHLRAPPPPPVRRFPGSARFQPGNTPNTGGAEISARGAVV